VRFFAVSKHVNHCRRLAKDWENLNRKALAFLRLASIRLTLRKLCNPACFMRPRHSYFPRQRLGARRARSIAANAEINIFAITKITTDAKSFICKYVDFGTYIRA
jgi:hypothetical protein